MNNPDKPIKPESGENLTEASDETVNEAREITDIRRMRDELTLQKTTLQTIIDSIPDLIFCKDLNFKYTLLNAACIDYLNMDMNSVIGKNDRELGFPDKVAEKMYSSDKKIFGGERKVVYDDWVPSFNGEARCLETTKAPLLQDGAIVGLVGISRDITEKTLLEKGRSSQELMPYGSVLIVDDMESNIFVVSDLLAPHGLKLDAVNSGLAAIEKIKNGNTYDIVFMDHMMPKMDGMEATKIIRDIGYKNPIVALTGNAVIGQAEKFLQNGFDDFLSKPIDIRLLNAVLKKFIRDRQPPKVTGKVRLQTDDKEQSHEKIPRQAIDPRFAEVLVRDASKSLAAMDAIIEKKFSCDDAELRLYTTYVHGMKTTLASIGKHELSADARELETAGRKGDIDVILSETPAFADSLRALIEEFSRKKETYSGAVDEDRSFLLEKLLAIKEASERYDGNNADKTITELWKKTWSKPTTELLNKIAGQLLHSNFDEVAEIVEKEIRRIYVGY